MTRAGYNGVALTLIDSLDTLAVLGNASEFARGVRWVGGHVSFDLDIDVSSACNPPATHLRPACDPPVTRLRPACDPPAMLPHAPNLPSNPP